MKGIFRIIFSKLGINKAIVFTSSSSIIGAIGTIISMFLVMHQLSATEQGFYYTFGSLIAIQIFFELGLNNIITQYVAHEVSFLSLNNDSIQGDVKYISRLSSLLHFSFKWYLFFASVLLFCLLTVGIVFFNYFYKSVIKIDWEIPWMVLSIGTAMNLFISPIFAFLQGLGKVKEIAKIQFLLQIFKFSIICIGLIFGAKLYVLGISTVINLFFSIIFIYNYFGKIIHYIWAIKIKDKVQYRSEIFPYQWKIALSWISGYFIFQLFNPIIFATEGPVAAGQMGMTMAALNGIFSLSLAWSSTKVPLFSGLIAQKKFIELDFIFDKTLRQSVLINAFGLILLYIVIFVLKFYKIQIGGKIIGDRFLNLNIVLVLMIPIFLNQFVSSWATYLRCHKKEPFLLISIVSAILCSMSTIILGKFYGVVGVTSGYSILTLLLFPWSYYIFKTKKVEWHNLNYQLSK